MSLPLLSKGRLGPDTRWTNREMTGFDETAGQKLLHVLFAGLANEQMVYDLSLPDSRTDWLLMPAVEEERH